MRPRDPYHNPAACCGELIAQQAILPIFMRTWWAAEGQIKAQFDNEIIPAIDLLCVRADTGPSSYILGVYMRGRAESSASPYVLISSHNKGTREAVYRLLTKNLFPEIYPQFGIKRASMQPFELRPSGRLSGEAEAMGTSQDNNNNNNNNNNESRLDASMNMGIDAILSSNGDPSVGRKLFTSTTGDRSARSATGGVVLRIGNKYYQKTVGHIEDQEYDVAQDDPREDSTWTCDDDSDDESDDDNDLPQSNCDAMSRESRTPAEQSTSSAASRYEDSGADTSNKTASPLSQENEQNNTVNSISDQALVEHPSSPSRSVDNPESAPKLDYIGSLQHNCRKSTSPSLDYALVSIDTPFDTYKVNRIYTDATTETFVQIQGVGAIPNQKRDIITVTASRGFTRGKLMPDAVYSYEHPKQAALQKLFVVQLDKKVFDGDCGADIVDEETGLLYGHIVRGGRGTDIAYIVPAKEVFQHLEDTLDMAPVFVAQARDSKDESPVSNDRSLKPSHSDSRSWHWESLYESKVHTCYDRGDDYYEEDRRQSRQTDPARDVRSTEEWNELAGRIKDEIKGSVLTPPGDVWRYFLPRNRLVEILTPERVLVVISNLPGSMDLCKEDQETFAAAVYHGDNSTKKSLKLLAALLISDLKEEFYPLVQAGVSDMCLPFTQDEGGNRSSIVCRSCQSCRADHSYLNDKNPWKLRKFRLWTYVFNAPYFKRLEQTDQESGQHVHYVLSHEDVLPVVGNGHSENNTSRSSNSIAARPGVEHEGGFSTVKQVVFHDDHFDLGSQKGEKYKKFAMKQLTSATAEDFKKEVVSLLRVNDGSNQSIVKLLATFEIRQNGSTQYYLIFPWAEGTLWDFWKIHDAVEIRTKCPPWMAEQCYKLALALQSFHNERNNQLRQLPSATENDPELFGRHGDIKAESILWFKRQNELVLNDFGLARLNAKYSRSQQNPETMARSETYRAPEFDMPHGKISRSSDIFSLGCAFLEFVTWYMEGHDSASETFPDRRMERDPKIDFVTDTFFRIEDGDGGKSAVIKTGVKTWIQGLKQNPRCSNYINQFLELIESHMLEPDPEMRWGSRQVVEKLKLFSLTCRADTSYWNEPKGL